MKQRKRTKSYKHITTPASIAREQHAQLSTRLDRIDQRLASMAEPASMQAISEQLAQLSDQLGDIQAATKDAAIKHGAVAGAMAGGVAGLVVSTAVLLLRAKMGL
ncbi:hypothetical protein I6G97_09725 [Edwardsiella hoshinae]|uniref:Uncharacterized protein n=1 Tax=Edwardsiella hoshinae TaxID=93378 RepID=A0A376DHC5_9GAMM|nr:hypothetical protein [Edwardsiella hoshinae]QPR26766.1 hypothetical protein I6G97_09725 [Edwardsiella hoshinae]STC89470.1 Uncharacterised protein [Edwardsiella hoshinae]